MLEINNIGYELDPSLDKQEILVQIIDQLIEYMLKGKFISVIFRPLLEYRKWTESIWFWGSSANDSRYTAFPSDLW